MQSHWLTTHSKYIIIYGNNKEGNQTQRASESAHQEARRRLGILLSRHLCGRQAQLRVPETVPAARNQSHDQGAEPGHQSSGGGHQVETHHRTDPLESRAEKDIRPFQNAAGRLDGNLSCRTGAQGRKRAETVADGLPYASPLQEKGEDAGNRQGVVSGFYRLDSAYLQNPVGQAAFSQKCSGLRGLFLHCPQCRRPCGGHPGKPDHDTCSHGTHQGAGIQA